MVFNVWFCPSALMWKTMDKLDHSLGEEAYIILTKWPNIRFSMYVNGNAYSAHIHRSRIRNKVLSVIRFHDEIALWPLSHTAKGSVSFSASHQTTIALPLVLADNKSRQAGALNSIEDESIWRDSKSHHVSSLVTLIQFTRTEWEKQIGRHIFNGNFVFHHLWSVL